MLLIHPDNLPDTIPEAFAAVAREATDKIALQTKQGDTYRQYSYREVLKQVQALAGGLLDMGLRPGERVAIVAENRPEWAITYLGIVTAGGTAVPLDIQIPPAELAVVLAESESRIVVASAQTLPLIATPPADLPVVSMDTQVEPSRLTLHGLILQGLHKSLVQVHTKPDDVASLVYTSGTTKRPKGVLLTHQNLIANAKAMMSSGLAGPEDNFLVMLPLHHTYPFMIAFLVPLLLGARMTFLQSLKPPDLVQCLRETDITMLIGVPQVFALIRRAIFDELGRRPRWVRLALSVLLSLSGVLRKHTAWNVGRAFFAPLHKQFGASLRLLCSGGAKLDPQVAKDLTRLGFTILEGYGLTETSPVVTFTPLGRTKIGSVGPPLSNVEIRIISPDESGIGEVAVRGPSVMKGYDRNPEATGQAIREGWFHTGDLGYLDRERYLFVTGRLKELIVTPGGKNIVPEELEAEYQVSPAIKELCLIGRKQEGQVGETLHAVVVPNLDYLRAHQVLDVPALLKDELRKAALSLPPYKRILGVTFVTEPLPRTRLGKIQRHLVKARLQPGFTGPSPKPELSEQDRELLATDTAQQVFSTLASMLPAERDITLEHHLDLDLGLDSLRQVELLVALERQFGPLQDTLGAEVATVRELIDKLRSLKREQPEVQEEQLPWRDILQTPPPSAVIEALHAQPSWSDRLATKVGIAVMEGIFRIFFRLTVRGQTHIPAKEAFLLAANHASFLDPFFILTSVPRSVCARLFSLGWEPYFRSTFTAWIARVGHVIRLGPKTPLVIVLRTSAAVVRDGKCLLIFPEGQRSLDGHLLPFKKGVGVLACELGVPVIPVHIQGSYEAWPPEAGLPRPSPITVHFGNSLTITSSMITQWREQGEDPHEAAASLIREAVVYLSDAPED